MERENSTAMRDLQINPTVVLQKPVFGKRHQRQGTAVVLMGAGREPLGAYRSNTHQSLSSTIVQAERSKISVVKYLCADRQEEVWLPYVIKVLAPLLTSL
jgi:hypothetical protein